MLPVLEQSWLLTLSSGGRLLPWLGPAVRGLVARRFKARVCRFTAREQNTSRLYCKGCPNMAGCPYGESIEPDPPTDRAVFSGQDDSIRPLVIAPAFPAPNEGRVGDRLALKLLFIGTTAAQHATEFGQALAEAGADRLTGLGPDHVMFTPTLVTECRLTPNLAVNPADPQPPWPRLRVVLNAPLIARKSSDAGRTLLDQPSFEDLFGASLRTLGRLNAYYADRLPDDVFTMLKATSRGVTLVESRYRVYSQGTFSNRRLERGTIRGVIGEAVFADVPTTLARWLMWGGALHVGTSRVSGAGGWEVFWGNRDARLDSHSGVWQRLS